MNKNVVRIQTEMFKPAAVVQGPLVDLYTDPPLNSAWWPHLPRFTWLDDPEAGRGQMLRFDEGGFFFTFAALGIEINGRTNGDIDFLLQTTPPPNSSAQTLRASRSCPRTGSNTHCCKPAGRAWQSTTQMSLLEGSSS